jgi:hypothetical protein
VPERTELVDFVETIETERWTVNPFFIGAWFDDGVTRRDGVFVGEAILECVDVGDTRLVATGDRGAGPRLGDRGDRGLRADEDATLDVVDSLWSGELASDAVLNALDASLVVEIVDVGRSDREAVDSGRFGLSVFELRRLDLDTTDSGRSDFATLDSGRSNLDNVDSGRWDSAIVDSGRSSGLVMTKPGWFGSDMTDPERSEVEADDGGRSIKGGCGFVDAAVPALVFRMVDARDRTDVTEDAEDFVLLLSAIDWLMLG